MDDIYKRKKSDGYNSKEELEEMKRIRMIREPAQQGLSAGNAGYAEDCGRWQKTKPDKPCYFVHRYDEGDNYPSLFEAVIDSEILCVMNIPDDEFVETMDKFADGEFFIIRKESKPSA
ncbi:MAG: hypothetical protein UR73_C0038G0018 [candidate division WS6 bacterium GW2011_GWF1_35_23]|uniref:Uncharacterized protein n=1 Tax=candidate division WS6 bacterium GW2011_GWF1_35_23 TaxID=1619097 RepID=A0A0G0EHC1_9BACT|nr:MAG: hypothetical protein UR73_C0038G0018 [candidate division WS6 bacterium GW2011_GWF1_35_23]KKQ29802.1 MAG: hypothetical protein US46_C0017G0018 [Candidatus Shapirobacteria bacterium GW2011_GWF2_37_20]